MVVYMIGEKIREERNRQKIAGEELCYGICSTSTLSRIENGTQKPSLKVEEALLQRLGCNTVGLERNADRVEVEIYLLENELTVLTMHRQPVEEKLKEYERYIKKRGTNCNLEKQFLLMTKAIYAFYTGSQDILTVYQVLEEALTLSMPDYAKGYLRKVRLFTQTEITIINNMALILSKQNKDTQAIEMMQYLIRYLEEERADAEMVMKKYPMLLCNLAQMLKKQRRYYELLEICEKGIQFDNRFARSGSLAEFFFYKAVAYNALGQYSEAEECYTYAIMLYQVTGKPDCAQQLINEKDEFFISCCKKVPAQRDTVPSQRV